MEAARSLARAFHENHISLVYGGGTFGIMGEIAKTLVSLSGPDSVHGIIPRTLMKFEQDNTHALPDPNVFGRMTIVNDMHARKKLMGELVNAGGPGSGFVALPGGFGTMEELMEVTTWNQLGIHSNGVVVFNVEGYWDGIMAWINKGVEKALISPDNKHIIVDVNDADAAVKALKEYKNSKARFDLVWEDAGP
jgi:uncharacterized protein (TIGR00730 family)